MGPFEYVLLFEAIILGLAVSDLAKSVHRLLAAGARVKWDWLAPLAALMILVKIVNHWWAWFGLEHVVARLTFEMFLSVLAATLLLYLISASALPDEVPEGPIDLRAHYERVSHTVWILFIAHGVLVIVVADWAHVSPVGASRLGTVLPYLIPPAALSLLVVRNRWWHGACLTALSLLYVAEFLGQVLSS